MNLGGEHYYSTAQSRRLLREAMAACGLFCATETERVPAGKLDRRTKCVIEARITVPPRSAHLLNAMAAVARIVCAAGSIWVAQHPAGASRRPRRHDRTRHLQADAATLPAPARPVSARAQAGPADCPLTRPRHDAVRPCCVLAHAGEIGRSLAP